MNTFEKRLILAASVFATAAGDSGTAALLNLASKGSRTQALAALVAAASSCDQSLLGIVLQTQTFLQKTQQSIWASENRKATSVIRPAMIDD